MCFCVEDNLVEGQYVRWREKKVEILERLGLRSCVSSDHRYEVQGRLTSQKLSMLSLNGGGTALTLPMEL